MSEISMPTSRVLTISKRDMDFISRTKAIITDGDDTLWTGRIPQALGAVYLKREFIRAHFKNVASGLNGMVKIGLLLRKGLETAENEAQPILYETLIKCGLGTESEFIQYTLDYVRKNMLKSTTYVLSKFTTGPKILATILGSTSSNTIVTYAGLSDYVSNKDFFDEKGNLKGFEMNTKDGDQKLSAVKDVLRKYDIPIYNCTMIGDNERDIPLLKAAGMRIASPRATKEVRNIANVQLAE